MKALRGMALHILDLLGRASNAVFGRRNQPAAPLAAPKFLLLRTDHLGDVLMSTALVDRLRGAFPGCRIDMAVKRYSVEAVANNPGVSNIFILNTPWTCHTFQSRDGYAATLGKALRLRKRQYDFVLALQEDFRTNILAAIIAGWPRKGLSMGLARAGCASFLDLPVELPPEPVHAVERSLAFLGPLGIGPGDPHLRFLPLPEARKRVRALLESAGIDGPFVAVHAGAGAVRRCLPAGKLSRILEMAADKGLSAVLVGGPADRERSLQVARAMKSPALVATGLSLDETAWIILESRALLCHDTGTMHLCCALDHPCVAIFGPSDERVWGPWSSRATVVTPKNFCCRPCGSNPTCESAKCLEAIDDSEVIRAILDPGRAGVEEGAEKGRQTGDQG